MSDSPEDPGPILAGEAEGEDVAPECRIAGCGRTGAVPRKMPDVGRDDRAREEYVCRYHHRILLAMKAGIAAAAIAILVAAIYVSV